MPLLYSFLIIEYRKYEINFYYLFSEFMEKLEYDEKF